MKYTSEDINIIIKAIKDYKRIVGIIKSYKDSDTSYEDLKNDLIKINGISLINEEIEKKFKNYNLVINGFIDFYYYDMILTIQVDDNMYELVSGIQVIDKDGSCIDEFNDVIEMQKAFDNYVYSRIKNYVDTCNNEDLKKDYEWYNVIGNNKDYLLENMYESFTETMENKEMKKEVDKLDDFVKMQEMKKEKEYTDYDLEVMLYLALEIKELLYNEKHFFIDIYCEEIKNIYEDYKKHDDVNMTLLDSINKYIKENEKSIKERFKDAFDTF